MRDQHRTREAERTARRILTTWWASSRYLADIPSLARIIDEEMHRPELLQLHVRYERLLAAFVDRPAASRAGEEHRQVADGALAPAAPGVWRLQTTTEYPFVPRLVPLEAGHLALDTRDQVQHPLRGVGGDE